MVRTITTDECLHICPSCNREFPCEHLPQDCNDSRFMPCEPCIAGALRPVEDETNEYRHSDPKFGFVGGAQ